MTAVAELLQRLVDDGALTGATVARIAGGDTDVVTVGHADLAREVPLRRDHPFRLASVTKPIVAALALVLVDACDLALDDPIDRWVPELARPGRPVLLRHLLDSTCGWGFPGDLSMPRVEALLAAVGDGRRRHTMPEPDAWIRALATVPPLFEPGEQWLYDTSSDLLAVVLARAAATPLPVLLADRLLRPLGMHDSGFATTVPAVQGVRHRDGRLHDADQDDTRVAPRFPSGAGGLIGTVDDLLRFAHMLLEDGAPVLRPATVERMTSDRLSAEQRRDAGGFLDGQSWGWGGCVDISATRPWEAVGRYGWVGVTGTSLHVRRDAGTALIVLTSRELFTAEDTALLESIWTAASAV